MSRWLTVGLLASVLGACAFVGSKGDSTVSHSPTSSVEPRRGERHLAQIDFGQRARFAECANDDCPARTPKTIAAESKASPPPARLAEAAPATTPSMPPLAAAAQPLSVSSEVAEQRLVLRFALGRSALTGEHKSQLRAALTDLRRSTRIRIAGRTDDLGSEALNQSLALARGLAVRDFLLSLDPQLPARISIDARGRCCYVADNDSEQSRSRNRRVELAYAGASGIEP
jgi:outer membrane protein OmpA-like peptidoglycan-associated protein